MNYPGLPAVTGSEMQSVFLKQIDDCGITITESQVNSIYDCAVILRPVLIMRYMKPKLS